MKINFDLLQGRPSDNSPHRAKPIKVEIESPVYEKIYKSVSPHNYRNELDSIGHLINIPQSVSEFIAQQISKEIQSQTDENEHGGDQESLQQNAQTFSNQSFKPQAALEKKQEDPLNRQMKERKQQREKKGKMSWVYQYKKHSCSYAETEAMKEAKQLGELSLRPKLHQNKHKLKVQKSRQANKMMTKQYNVYDNLYKDAAKRQYKNQMFKEETSRKQEPRKPKINQNYLENNKKTYTSIFNRMNNILERREKRRAQQQNYDLTTGREMFKPDLNSSQDSYRIFFQSLSKEKVVNKRRQQSAIEVKAPKKKSLKNLEDSLDSKTINFFIDMFYPEANEGSQIADGLNSIGEKQFLILQPFLHFIEEIQSKKYEQQTTISSVKVAVVPGKVESVMPKDEFKEHFTKFYEGLTLHDKQILRSEVMKKKREKLKIYEEQNLDSTFRPSINIRSSSLDNLAKGHLHQIYYV